MDTVALFAIIITLAFTLVSWHFIRKVLIEKGVEPLPRILLAACYGLLTGYVLYPFMFDLMK